MLVVGCCASDADDAMLPMLLAGLSVFDFSNQWPGVSQLLRIFRKFDVNKDGHLQPVEVYVSINRNLTQFCELVTNTASDSNTVFVWSHTVLQFKKCLQSMGFDTSNAAAVNEVVR